MNKEELMLLCAEYADIWERHKEGESLSELFEEMEGVVEEMSRNVTAIHSLTVTERCITRLLKSYVAMGGDLTDFKTLQKTLVNFFE